MGFDPISLTMMAAAGGAVLSAAGSYESGKAGKNAADYQAQVAANNAQIATQNETLAIESGEQTASNQSMKTRATVGATVAGQGASGVDVNSKSFTDVRAGEAELGHLDALTIRSNAARQAYGYAVKAVSETAQSKLDTSMGEQSMLSGEIGAASSLLGGASSAGSKYAAWQLGNPGGGGGGAAELGLVEG